VQLLKANTDIIFLSLEDFSQELKDNKKAKEVMIFVTDILSVVSGYDFTRCFNTECQDLECQHCSNNVIAHGARHLKQQILKVISENKVSSLRLTTEQKLSLLEKCLPQLIGTINSRSVLDSAEIFKGRYKAEIELFEEPLSSEEYNNIEAPKLLKEVYKTLSRFNNACSQSAPNALENLIEVTFHEVSRLENKYKVPGSSKGETMKKLTMAFYRLYNNNLDGLMDVIEYSTKSRDQAQNISEFIKESVKLVDMVSLKQMASAIPKFHNNADFEFVKQFFAKTKDKHAEPKDLFRLLDRAGDSNGSVSVDEFAVLAKRLEIPLSDNRIREIFTHIKGEAIANESSSSLDLDNDEFVDATEYLKKKQIYHAQRIIGVTSEALYPMLIYLLFLRLLIFSLIFVDIKAFALEVLLQQ
jgi:hypothetical protein